MLLRRSLLLVAITLAGCRAPVTTAATGSAAGYDVIIEGGRLVDGTGSQWRYADVALRGDQIARIAPPGMLTSARAAQRVNARGLVVAPGFIDIQAQSYENFMLGDGRALSMVTQGITTAILGEGSTPAPKNPKSASDFAEGDTAVERQLLRFAGPRGFGVWLESMTARGTSQNVGSFLGAGTVRSYVMGSRTGAPNAAELDTMRAVTARAMRDGAFGVASALIYTPGAYAGTDELVEIAKAMAPFGGLYISHMRSEGDQFLEALGEAIAIGKRGGVPVEVYHLKASGPRNWPKMATAIATIDSARAAGQDVAADMYLYVAGGNSMTQCIPAPFHVGGKLLANLTDAAVRPKVAEAMRQYPSPTENLCQVAGPENVMVVGLTSAQYKPYEGKRLADVMRGMNTGKDWAETIIDLVIAEQGRGPGEILFLMSEENVKKQIALPWMKFGTDAGSMDPATARGLAHPRTYGNYPRLLGKYVRQERVIPLEEAVRKSTAAVATRLGITDRGLIAEGMKADVVLFDPATIIDRATFEQPHQLSEGVRWVFVNGQAVLANGAHTGAKPGVVVRGAGWDGVRATTDR
ncbi:MAG: D-aminoacylase [Gemmatimonadaceae bacterium]|jgi:dihydroorotase/N-acyl-D-amino-acid deacylase|nr:D-aminoacylase [Gemmatimonadaceae bacterium]